MANEKSIAHELLAQEILKSFKGKITGDNADYIVGENPENRYFVGKLLPVSDSPDIVLGVRCLYRIDRS